MSFSNILIIEDTNEIQEILRDLLRPNHNVLSAFSGTEGLLIFKHEKVDLILLDIMLPGRQGDEVLQEIRQLSQVPVIIMSALSDKKRITEFLLKGANDYITKPFDLEELSARVAVQLRNQQKSQTKMDDHAHYGRLVLNCENFSLGNGKAEVTLSHIEFEILKMLMTNPQKIFTKENLYESVWHEKYIPGDNTVNTHLSNLRKKLSKIEPEIEYIETIWGLGVRMAKVNE